MTIVTPDKGRLASEEGLGSGEGLFYHQVFGGDFSICFSDHLVPIVGLSIDSSFKISSSISKLISSSAFEAL